MDGKVNREDFLSRVAKRTGLELSDVNTVYYGIVSEIEDIARSGDKLSLAGFGSFYVQMHKGHPVQFGTHDRKVDDYMVFKFSASNVFNKKLRRTDDKIVGVVLDSSTLCAMSGDV